MQIHITTAIKMNLKIPIFYLLCSSFDVSFPSAPVALLEYEFLSHLAPVPPHLMVQFALKTISRSLFLFRDARQAAGPSSWHRCPISLSDVARARLCVVAYRSANQPITPTPTTQKKKNNKTLSMIIIWPNSFGTNPIFLISKFAICYAAVCGAAVENHQRDRKTEPRAWHLIGAITCRLVAVYIIYL